MSVALPDPIGVAVCLLGGPTLVLELAGRRLLTDPTFDPPGEYPIGQRKLVKTAPPALPADRVGPVDAVLLSHDQHPDNLDRAGRALLGEVPIVLTTPVGAERLGPPAVGLEPWSAHALPGGALEVVAVPARHGPPGCEPLTGDVTGFVLRGSGLPTVYVSGDNAAPELVAEIAARFPAIDLAVLFAGAARTSLIPDGPLTLTAEQAAEAARVLGARRVIVAHTDSWAHYTEDGDAVRRAFASHGLSERLVATPAGRVVRI